MSERTKCFFALRPAMAMLALALCLGSQAHGQSRNPGETKTISLGIVSAVNRSLIVNHFRDFVGYVVRRLGDDANVDGKVIVAPTPFQLAKLIEQRRVDFFFESAYPTYIIDYVHGVGRPILRRWKSGMAEYQSLIIAARNGITRIEDLRGHTIAFEDPSSTSGYLLAKEFLLRRGFKLVEKPRLDTDPSPTEVRYVFTYSQAKVVDWVLTKQAAAGAISNDDLAALDAKTKKDLIVLAETERLPRHLVSVRADLAPALVARIERILLGMHEEGEGRRILNQIDGTTKFDALPGGEPGLRRLLAQSFSAPGKK